MGILLMGMALAYIAVNAVIIALIGWVASRFTDKPRRWVIGATLVSILIVFGDWLPIWATHRYYCATKAGLSVYKMPEEWKKAHPGVAEKLTWRDLSKSVDDDNGSIYFLNQRILWEIRYVKLPLIHWMKRQRLVDRKTGETLVEKRDISLRLRNGILGGKMEFESMKLWLQPYNQCPIDDSNRHKWLYQDKSFGQLIVEYKKIGRKADE